VFFDRIYYRIYRILGGFTGFSGKMTNDPNDQK
jgi:hypothetical protein